MLKQQNSKTNNKKLNGSDNRAVVTNFGLKISRQPAFNRRTTLGLFVILVQLAAVFVLVPHYTPGIKNPINAKAAEEPAIDAYVDDTFVNSNLTTEQLANLSFDNSVNISTITRDGNSEDAEAAHTNALRNLHGKADYVRSACLTGIARAYAKAYATYGVRVANTKLRDQIKANCTTHVGAVAEILMAQDTECHAWVIMTAIRVPSDSNFGCPPRTTIAKVACGDRSNILDARVPSNPACNPYPSGYPYGFKYFGVGAYRNPNGLVYIVQDFAGCSSSCFNLPAALGKASIFPNQMRPGERLDRGDQIRSGNGFRFFFQPTDGNAVVYSPSGVATWSTNTQHQYAYHVKFQTDGNLVVYNSDNSKALWWSGTQNRGGRYVVMQNDGNLVIYSAGYLPLWSSKTGLLVKHSCTNPFAGGSWTLQRIDQGVDYGPNGEQPVNAICDGRIISLRLRSDWPPNPGLFIVYKFTAGPLAGKCAYIAESLRSQLQASSTTPIYAGQRIATAYPGASDTEWGWAVGDGVVATPGGGETEGGKAFDRFMASLGGPNHNIGDGPIYAGASCP